MFVMLVQHNVPHAHSYLDLKEHAQPVTICKIYLIFSYYLTSTTSNGVTF